MKIRYYGHAGQLTGYGRAAEMMILALARAGADVEIRTLAPYDGLRFGVDEDGTSADLPLASMLRADHELAPDPDVVIVHTLPLDCHRVVEHVQKESAGAVLSTATKWVAYTTWEADSPIDKTMARSFMTFDEVWHPSERSAMGFLGPLHHNHDGLVQVVPHCVDEGAVHLRRQRVKLDAQAEPPYRFYSIGAFTARKNPIALIRAFAHAFDKSDKVELLLACQGMTAQHLMHAVCATGYSPLDLPPIRGELQTLADDQIWKLHQGADCFVTATRGEAWNLPAFEAMVAGRHVIAPQMVGHCHFLHSSSADLYPSHPAPALVDTRAVKDERGTQIQVVGAQGLTSKARWREPDLMALADAMRVAYKARTSDLKFPDADEICRDYGTLAVGQHAMSMLENLLNRKPH